MPHPSLRGSGATRTLPTVSCLGANGLNGFAKASSPEPHRFHLSVTLFLGAGKSTLVRHALQNARGRRLAVIVNEFGEIGVDGEMLRGCGIENCPEDAILELPNGCLCCTVADDFVPALEKLL